MLEERTGTTAKRRNRTARAGLAVKVKLGLIISGKNFVKAALLAATQRELLSLTSREGLHMAKNMAVQAAELQGMTPEELHKKWQALFDTKTELISWTLGSGGNITRPDSRLHKCDQTRYVFRCV